MKKYSLILVFVLLVAVILRFWQLGQIPVSMTDDETRLVYNAYSIWHTAKDVSGQTLPLSFLVSGYSFNPIAIYLTSPFVGLLGLSMFSARLPFAVTGVLTILILYFLSYLLLKSRSIAIFSSLALTFSVWHLQISRFAYEGEFALFFYLLGILFFILIKRTNLLVTSLSMTPFLIAFYSYSGTKLIFLPVLVVLIWYKYRDLNLKQLILVGFFILLTLTSFVYLTKTQNAASYGGQQFFFQNTADAAKAVELERRASLAPEFFKRLYHNKLTYWSKIFISQYSYAFSPQYLFTSQEGSGIFSIWFRGQMYYIEAPLLLMGMLYLFQKKRRELFLILSFLIIAPIPSALGSDPITYTIRSSFMLPWLMILVGSGIYSISYFIKKMSIRTGVYILLAIIYIYLIGGYLNQYYFEWVKYGPKYYSKAAQDLSLLVSKEKNRREMIIVSPGDSTLLLHYAFYNKLPPKLVQNLYKKDPIRFDNILFQKKCPVLSEHDLRNELTPNSLYIVAFECPGTKGKSRYSWNPNYIIKSPDNLDEWLVFNNLKQ